MPQKAHVTSVEAIEAFRSALLVYLSKARPALEEVGSDVMRVHLWVQNDQRSLWEKEVKRRARKLEEAQAALFNANMSQLRDVTAAEQLAVSRAKREIAEAEDKLRGVKHWERDFENQTDPLLKQTEKLTGFLAVDLPNAAAYLAEVIKTLEAYAEMQTPGSLEPAPAATGKIEDGGGGDGKERA
jgi:hypothetical protein